MVWICQHSNEVLLHHLRVCTVVWSELTVIQPSLLETVFSRVAVSKSLVRNVLVVDTVTQERPQVLVVVFFIYTFVIEWQLELEFFLFAACQYCPAGQFNEKVGVAALVRSQTVHDKITYSHVCKNSKKGFYSQRGSCFATQCSAGRYAAHSRMGACERCPVGKYGTAIGSSKVEDCMNCAAGKWGGYCHRLDK